MHDDAPSVNYLFHFFDKSVDKKNQKYLESSEMWSWKILEKISWTVRVRNEEGLLRVKEERNILHTKKRRKFNWIGHILRTNSLKNTLLKER